MKPGVAIRGPISVLNKGHWIRNGQPTVHPQYGFAIRGKCLSLSPFIPFSAKFPDILDFDFDSK